ncbi:Cys-tRNA(Pro) deacylase [Pseudoalteromonas xiamenensis]|uniref:Cys-tRNA(Pro) deacylase n=1 Tax=Pseudoalteromonas xiamenensis TaxID=882626 RepID=UPI0035EE9042
MTPAINLLKKSKYDFTVVEFEHDKNNTNFAKEAAQKLGIAEAIVFKTLLVDVDGKLHVAVTPCTNQVDLKRFAQCAGGKKATMADPKIAERTTGYLVGGISPFAQKKRLPTLLHVTAATEEKIYVSAGKRGVEVVIAPSILVELCSAKYAEF